MCLQLPKCDGLSKTHVSKTLTLQYLEALKALGEGAATKFLIPAELLNLTQPLIAHAREALEE